MSRAKRVDILAYLGIVLRPPDLCLAKPNKA